MAVSFVIGRAGSGKTRRCFTSIVEALRKRPLGPPIYWLLPRQATFSAERDLTCASGLGGFFRARVLSFEHLGQEILADCGGASIPEITPIGRQMILGHLLRRNAGELKFFKTIARQPGLAAKLDVTFREFERCGKNAADLDSLLKEFAGDRPGDNAALLDKVHDLHLIYNAYCAYLGQDRLDQHQRLLYVLKCIDRSKLFAGATVYVDSFLEFTEYERRVLARLGKVCKHVEITLPIDPASAVLREPDLFPDDHSLFHRVEMTYRRLRLVFREEKVPVDEPAVVLPEVHRFRTAALRAVENFGFGRASAKGKVSSEGIELVEAPTRAAEVDAAARRITELLRNGHRLRDIVVLARDLASYQDLIDISFTEHGIRYFVDRRRATAHHPLLQLARSVLMLAQETWPHEWVMTLLKTGLTGISASEADALENYVLKHRVRGQQWAAAEPWVFHDAGILREEDGAPAQELVETPNTADIQRQIIVNAVQPFIERLRDGGSVKEIVAGLFQVIEKFPVRVTLTKWIADARAQNEIEQANEHEQVWKDFAKLFDQMVELLGDERVSIAGFQEILEAGLEEFDLALTPPTVDEALIGQVDRTRTPEVRAVLVLGLNEGCFPRAPTEDSVLSDADRHELHRRKLNVTAATDRQLLDEQLLGYLAFTSASELLYLSRSRCDAKDKPLGPSVFWRRIAELFSIEPAILPREQRDDAALIATPRQLVIALMRWVHKQTDRAPATPDQPWPALYHWLATQPCDEGPIDAVRFGAWSALSYDPSAALTPDIAQQLFASPLRASVSQIEAFAACRFKHFLRFGLELQPRDDDPDVSALDLGQVYHGVLESVVSDLLKRRKTWLDLDETQKQKAIHAAVEKIGQSLRGEILLSSARNRYLLRRIEKTLGRVIDTQKAAAQRGAFLPAFSKVRFGEGGALPEFAVPTPKKRELRLSGKIDRIDVRAGGDEFIAIDYRLTNRTLHLEQVYYGISLQLLTYLLVLEANGQALAGRKLTPAAAFYVRMLRWLGDVKHPSEALAPTDPAFALQAKPRGILNDRYLHELDNALVKGASSEVINARLNVDGSVGSKGRSDLADPDEFAALLAHVRARLGELTDGILDGEIGIAPYMLGTQTPCPACEYRGVCRFEAHGGYRVLQSMSREDVLTTVKEKPTEARHGK